MREDEMDEEKVSRLELALVWFCALGLCVWAGVFLLRYMGALL